MADIDIDRVIHLSKGVATDYLVHGVDMNQSIAKVASESGLNGDQIQRVVETSNHIVYQYLYKKATDDKNVVFPLADAEKVAMERGNETVKLASESLSPPAEEHVSSTDYAYEPGRVKAEVIEQEKVATESTDDLAQAAMQKSAEEFRQAAFLPRISELIKSAMVEGSYAEGDPNFIDKYLVICKMATELSGDKWNQIQPIFEKVASNYYSTGFFSGDDLHKLANALVGNEALPDLPSNRVVNGDHILIKTLRAYIANEPDLTAAQPKGLRLDTKAIAES